ncbi:MAG: hypothetical protein DWI24_08255 [Planctomycetota bacterium]|nr:MAG: hypothetical protein DWI24_08255 [Planctomycetota bacterium]
MHSVFEKLNMRLSSQLQSHWLFSKKDGTDTIFSLAIKSTDPRLFSVTPEDLDRFQTHVDERLFQGSIWLAKFDPLSPSICVRFFGRLNRSL